MLTRLVVSGVRVLGDGYGHDAFEPGYSGNENDAPPHLPYVRHVHSVWTQDEHGRWVAGAQVDHQWEFVCVSCGDDEGPPPRKGDLHPCALDTRKPGYPEAQCRRPRAFEG